jgi:AraC family transcriptional regulator
MNTSENNTQSLENIIAFIFANLDETLTVESLSLHCRLSKFHFHRQFHAYTGINVGRFIQLARLKRASLQLVFNRQRRITDIAMDAGFDYPESFARAFRREYRQSPTQFRRKPDWQTWWITHHENKIHSKKEFNTMHVDIIDFPETLVAALEHHGPESQTYNTSMKFIEWRKENGVSPEKGNTYGIHYTDPKNTFPEDFRLDICVSIEKEVGENPQGVVNKSIPACRCAMARHTGSRDHVIAAEFLAYEWLPGSGEEMGDFPLFFHYVNVGPGVREQDMITDVYMPLKD